MFGRRSFEGVVFSDHHFIASLSPTPNLLVATLAARSQRLKGGVVLTSPQKVFAGNTADPSTVPAQVAKLKERFDIERIALVGDRDMLTTARIRETVAAAGLDLRPRSGPFLVRQGRPLSSCLQATKLSAPLEQDSERIRRIFRRKQW